VRGSIEGGSGVARSLVRDILVARGVERQTVEIERQVGEDEDRKRRQESHLQVEGVSIFIPALIPPFPRPWHSGLLLKTVSG
jgi:hypothetical protein